MVVVSPANGMRRGASRIRIGLTWVTRLGGGVAAMILAGWVAGCGSGGGTDTVVVYAAQDRVYAEPILAGFTRATGIEVRAVYDNEATKTAGLANRVEAERGRPLADVWWSNEEMRTRRLARRGVLDPDWRAFGIRRRVLVCREQDRGSLPHSPTLAGLTNAAWRGRVALAYPLFGTTTAHLLMLRERWGEAAWTRWCEALMANRPLLLDGNSMVVRRVAAGDALVGLTDTDDVEAARREGVALVALALDAAEDLIIPNTVAVVTGAPHAEAARRLAEYLASGPVVAELVRVGAISGAGEPGAAGADDARWPPLLEGWEPTTRQMEALFRR